VGVGGAFVGSSRSQSFHPRNFCQNFPGRCGDTSIEPTDAARNVHEFLICWIELFCPGKRSNEQSTDAGDETMFGTAIRGMISTVIMFLLTTTMASAHVKWFLGRSEADILKQPKPELFTQPSLENMAPIICTLIVLFITTAAGRDFSDSKINRRLTDLADGWEPILNLLMGLCLGGALIYCGETRTLLTPNFIICAHCPQWLPYAELFAGLSLIFGFFARAGAATVLALLGFTFMKHSMADCLDLVPLYGLASYFIICGRGQYSLDHKFGLEEPVQPIAINIGHLLVRWFAGVGLMILALDEKLLHPQLALEILKHAPSLNLLGAAMDNELFVLCAGLVELVLGLLIVVGSFPRLAAIALAGVFWGTTFIFGRTELLGHLPYYAIIVSLVARGSGSMASLAILRELSQRSVRLARARFAKQLA
jgi:uncharacterized membrane protein YphA (DoxX/SURF4 family)